LNSLLATAAALILTLCGVVAGRYLGRHLPKEHLQSETTDFVKIVVALITTMAAILLGLQLSSAKNSFDAQQAEVTGIAADAIIFDTALSHSGPGSERARVIFNRLVAQMIERTWPDEWHTARLEAPTGTREFYDSIASITPRNEEQRISKNSAISSALELGKQIRYLGNEQTSWTSRALLVVELAWITIIFTSFGLIAPRNGTALAALILCACAVAIAIFLIVEMSEPFSGFIHIPSTALREALAQIAP
jgi:hypothetical protein